jgi:tetratricopeptide (TPR) repeat protein
MGATSLRSAALNNLGEVYFALGDLDAAEECYIQARDICREIGGYVEGATLHNLGRVFLRLRCLDKAIASFTEALSKHRAAGLLDGEARTLRDLAEARAETGDMTGARASLAEATKIFEQIGDRTGAAETASLLVSLTAKLVTGEFAGSGRCGKRTAARASRARFDGGFRHRARSRGYEGVVPGGLTAG